MTPADLQKFCSTDPNHPELLRPFTTGGFTWATNGHIMVRVPVAEGILPPDVPVNVERALGKVDFAVPMRPMILGTIPEDMGYETCDDCGGDGKGHDCPMCSCHCPNCNGTGKERKNWSVLVGEAAFDLKYIRLIQTLPIPMIPVEFPVSSIALPFTFHGGIGALMALKYRYERHFYPEVTI